MTSPVWGSRPCQKPNGRRETMASPSTCPSTRPRPERMTAIRSTLHNATAHGRFDAGFGRGERTLGPDGGRGVVGELARIRGQAFEPPGAHRAVVEAGPGHDAAPGIFD